MATTVREQVLENARNYARVNDALSGKSDLRRGQETLQLLIEGVATELIAIRQDLRCDPRADSGSGDSFDLRAGLADVRHDLARLDRAIADQQEAMVSSVQALQGLAETTLDVARTPTDETVLASRMEDLTSEVRAALAMNSRPAALPATPSSTPTCAPEPKVAIGDVEGMIDSLITGL